MLSASCLSSVGPFKMSVANSVDPDQTVPLVAADLSPHCLSVC